MSNSTTLLDTISSTQANKEVVANALFDAASPAMLWGRHASTSSGLTWGYYGGMYYTSAAANAIANGTLTLTASTTCYVYADPVTGAVSFNTTGFPAGKIPLYSVVTGTSTVTSYTDERSYAPCVLTPLIGTIPYDMPMFFPGKMSNNQTLARVLFTRSVTFPASLTGTQCSAGTAATASTTVQINKNGVSIGTLVWAAAGQVPTITFSTATTFAAGDLLTLTGPATADTTLADISLTFAATR